MIAAALHLLGALACALGIHRREWSTFTVVGAREIHDAGGVLILAKNERAVFSHELLGYRLQRLTCARCRAGGPHR